MTSTGSIQKAALGQALTVAKAALRGQGGAEAGSNGRKIATASIATKKAHSAGVSLSRKGLKKLRIRV